jgi:hypothetical protein
MNREPKKPPLKTWQIYSAAIHHLGKGFLCRMYKVTGRQVERWAANPATTESQARNPIDRYESLLDRLIEIGAGDVARIAVARQAHLVGCELKAKNGDCEPDGDTIEDECLDDYPPLTRFHSAIRKKASAEEVLHFCQEAKSEIDETMELFLRRSSGGKTAAIEKGQGD